jgi:hypothetical protein
MRRLLTTIIRLLDSTPSEFHTAPRESNRQSGQSVVELALITPILITLFAGLVEIGWFANNYLNLMDVTRSGARRGSALQDEQSPLSWDDNGSPMPITALSADYQSELVGVTPYSTDVTIAAQQLNARINARSCAGSPSERPFYTEVICTMIASMEPLRFDATNAVDDVIVSAFAFELVDLQLDIDDTTDIDTGFPWLGANRPLAGTSNPDLPQVVVVGRYPANANECDAVINPSNPAQLLSLEPRDPFDFNENGRADRWAENPASIALPNYYHEDFSELAGYDAVAATNNDRERQVGFTWFGQHRIVTEVGGVTAQTLCLGSEWTQAELERFMNLRLSEFVPDEAASVADIPNVRQQRNMLPGQGLVMVEVFWQHKLLLNLPFFTVLAQNSEINVWAAFPLPSVERPITFR